MTIVPQKIFEEVPEASYKNQVNIYVSCTPAGDYELQASSQGFMWEQIIRPTGLLDPILKCVPKALNQNRLFFSGEFRPSPVY